MDSVFFTAVVFFSFVHVGSSRLVEEGTPCVQEILPCQPFLAAPAPDPVCCVPLKEAFRTQKECLCSLFNNPELLKSFNVTREQALKLPAACGIKADASVCGEDGPTVSPSSPKPPSGSTNSSSSTATPPHSNSARGMGQSDFHLFACLSTLLLACYIF